MDTNENGTLCGLPAWIGIARIKDTDAYINNILLAVVNGSFATFAFLSNLVIIIAIVKTPSLQKPSNILLCGLAFTDCLIGITAQPMFVAWRFYLQRAQTSCLYQQLMFDLYYILNLLTVGLLFSNITVNSFDRHYALSRPLVYRANATKQSAIKTAILVNLVWPLYPICVKFVFPSHADFIAHIISALWLVIVPIINHVRMLFAIRHHNRQMGDAVAAQQMSALMRREKKVAINMCVVAIILLASSIPPLSIKLLEFRYPRVHAIALPWSLTMAFMTSSINPVFYLSRNPDLRNAVKSLFCFI